MHTDRLFINTMVLLATTHTVFSEQQVRTLLQPKVILPCAAAGVAYYGYRHIAHTHKLRQVLNKLQTDISAIESKYPKNILAYTDAQLATQYATPEALRAYHATIQSDRLELERLESEIKLVKNATLKTSVESLLAAVRSFENNIAENAAPHALQLLVRKYHKEFDRMLGLRDEERLHTAVRSAYIRDNAPYAYLNCVARLSEVIRQLEESRTLVDARLIICKDAADLLAQLTDLQHTLMSMKQYQEELRMQRTDQQEQEKLALIKKQVEWSEKNYTAKMRLLDERAKTNAYLTQLTQLFIPLTAPLTHLAQEQLEGEHIEGMAEEPESSSLAAQVAEMRRHIEILQQALNPKSAVNPEAHGVYPVIPS